MTMKTTTKSILILGLLSIFLVSCQQEVLEEEYKTEEERKTQFLEEKGYKITKAMPLPESYDPTDISMNGIYQNPLSFDISDEDLSPNESRGLCCSVPVPSISAAIGPGQTNALIVSGSVRRQGFTRFRVWVENSSGSVVYDQEFFANNLNDCEVFLYSFAINESNVNFNQSIECEEEYTVIAELARLGGSFPFYDWFVCLSSENSIFFNITELCCPGC